MMPDASLERTYEGKKEMLLMENVEDKEYLTDLFKAIYDELPAPKPKKKKWSRRDRARLFKKLAFATLSSTWKQALKFF